MRSQKPPISFDDLRADPSRLVLAPPGQLGAALLLVDYRPWPKVQYIARDEKIDPTHAWAMVKSSRLFNWRPLALTQDKGGPFGFCAGEHLIEPLHRIDREAKVELEPDLIDDSKQRRLEIETVMGESTESSLIEGAATTREEAMDMLRAGRPARQRGEQMVLNNYIAMQQVKGWLARPLTIDMLLELQGILVDGTLDNPAAKGRLRTPGENVRVVDTRDQSVLHTPPHAGGLHDRLQRLCDFANTDHAGDQFIHPVVKACILHFMLGYEHPFVDGNGRTARAIFYWHVLRQKYSIFEFLSISEVIRRGQSRYSQAYLDSELDDGDLTYFIIYMLDVIRQALEQLGTRLRDEEETIERSRRLLRLSGGLNLRQRLLLENAMRHPMTHSTVKSHMNSNGVSKNTARADLDDLVHRRLMVTEKGQGKEVMYLPAPGLKKRLEKRA